MIARTKNSTYQDTVAIPIWVKHGINAWMIAAGIEDGRLLRSVSKRGRYKG